MRNRWPQPEIYPGWDTWATALVRKLTETFDQGREKLGFSRTIEDFSTTLAAGEEPPNTILGFRARGLYEFEYLLRVQTAVTTDGVRVIFQPSSGVNFVGILEAMQFAASQYQAHVSNASSSILIPTLAVANAPCLVRIKGLIQAGGAGEMRLKFGSETEGKQVWLLTDSIGTLIHRG